MEKAARDILRAALVAAVLAGAGGLAGCTDDPGLTGLCQADDECPANFKCDEGRCSCAADVACKENEFCNLSGSCQARIGCESSFDCPVGQYCDRETGNCLDRERCTADVQCALDEICDGLRFSCVKGCRDAGDCRLGSVCECADPASSCGLKQCKLGPCGDDSYCRFGEVCVADAGGGPKRCRADERGPFCEACSIGPGQEYCAGDTPNFCLVDGSKGFGSYFCGVDCNAGQACPWGFGCHDILIPPNVRCGNAQNQCPLRPNKPCTTNDQCKGGVCNTVAGVCQSACIGNEGDVQGFCTCLEDTDCPTDTCDSFNHRCSISLKPCDPNQPNPCGTIFCKNVQDTQSGDNFGYCFIGRNCAPDEGISCEEVRANRQ